MHYPCLIPVPPSFTASCDTNSLTACFESNEYSMDKQYLVLNPNCQKATTRSTGKSVCYEVPMDDCPAPAIMVFYLLDSRNHVFSTIQVSCKITLVHLKLILKTVSFYVFGEAGELRPVWFGLTKSCNFTTLVSTAFINHLKFIR